MISRALGLVIGLLSSGVAIALTVDCGHLLDVAKGRWIDNARVQIADGKIVAVGDSPEVAGDDAVNLRQMWCLPGLMDMHTHLVFEVQPQVSALRDRLSLNPADHAFRAAEFARRTLLAGFTTVRDVGASDGLDVALKRAIEQGWVEGPRMFVSGKSLATSGGHADPTNSLSRELADALGEPGPQQGVLNGADEARQAVRLRYKQGADLIKITATGGVLSQAASGQNAQFTDAELAAVVETAKDYGFHVAAHAHGSEGIKRALRAGVSSIEHGTYLDAEAIRLFKRSGAWYVPTISAGRYVAEKAKEPDYYSPIVRPKAAAIGPLIQQTFARAYKAGVKIAFGTDAAVFPHGQNAGEFAYMVEAGMPPLEAIRSATLNAAELLDQPTTLGQVKPGFAADMVAVSGDPLVDVTELQRVAFVMKAGKIYKQPAP